MAYDVNHLLRVGDAKTIYDNLDGKVTSLNQDIGEPTYVVPQALVKADGSFTGEVGEHISETSTAEWQRAYFSPIAGKEYRFVFQTKTITNDYASIKTVDNDGIVLADLDVIAGGSESVQMTTTHIFTDDVAQVWVRGYRDGDTYGLSVEEKVTTINALQTDVNSISEVTECAYIDDDCNIQSSGIHVWADDGKAMIAGTSTATRRFLFLNGQSIAATTVTSFNKTFDAGIYYFTITGTDYLSATYTTYATGQSFRIYTNSIVEFTQPAMVGLTIANGTITGTEENPMIVTVSATKRIANDLIARADLGEVHQICTDLNDTKADKTEVALKADKTELAHTNRVVSALVDASKGKTLRFETDSNAGYQKVIPSGALSATPMSWGGRSVVWNQQIINGDFQSDTGWLSSSYTIGNGEAVLTVGTTSTSTALLRQQIVNFDMTHKYLFAMSLNRSIVDTIVFVGYNYSSLSAQRVLNFGESDNPNEWIRKRAIVSISDSVTSFGIRIGATSTNPLTSGTVIKVKDAYVYDLTQMYGAGNEPSTTDDPRIAEIESYVVNHPAYNAGEIVSADVDNIEYAISGATVQNLIPSAVLSQYPLRSAGSVYDTISFDGSKWWHTQNIDSIAMSNITFVFFEETDYDYFRAINVETNYGIKASTYNLLFAMPYTVNKVSTGDKTLNVTSHLYIRDEQFTDLESFTNYIKDFTLYFEKSAPVVTDITDLMGDVGDELIAMLVEAGGTITFKQTDTQFAIPNSIEYLVKISEVE